MGVSKVIKHYMVVSSREINILPWKDEEELEGCEYV